MLKGDRESMGTETKCGVLDIHFGGETHFDLRCLTVVEKASQISVNRKTEHLQWSMHSTPTAALKVILMLSPLGIYIEGETRQVTYRLNCSGEFTRASFGHLFWSQATKLFLLLLLEEGF
jgi:hypothetical protein